MHLQSLPSVPDLPLGQFNQTNQCVEVLHCLDIYVEAIKYLNLLISVDNLAQRNTEMEGRNLQVHQTV